MLRNTVVFLCLTLLSHFVQAADKVVLQLKWEHQFQFAGFYAADWQGFYRDAGLDEDGIDGASAFLGLAGTNVEAGRRILEESGRPIVTADRLADAAERAVAAWRGRAAAA